jgi:ParB family chromosome partitioning protein
MFSAAQLRVFLCALVSIDPYAFDDVAEQLTANDENNQQTSEEILLSTIDGLPGDKLAGFVLRLVFTGHTAIPREIDSLTEAEAAFAPLQPKKTASKKAKTATPIKTAAKKTTPRSKLQPTRSGSQTNRLPLFSKRRKSCSSSVTNSRSPSG